MTENEIGTRILGCAIRMHTRLGPGLLESTYEACLAYELARDGLKFERQRGLPLIYDDVNLECGYRLDLIVENKVIIEIKAVETLLDVHLAQILTYLKLTDCRLGYLINFNVPRCREGVRRVVNNL